MNVDRAVQEQTFVHKYDEILAKIDETGCLGWKVIIRPFLLFGSDVKKAAF